MTTPKRGQETSSNISQPKKKLYDWDNDNLKDNEGLVESDIAHPDLPAKFPGINL
jgi:hypothetical protein